ncbi:DUF6268 family outer membrane beta-barrel protein [Ekhidna sp.]
MSKKSVVVTALCHSFIEIVKYLNARLVFLPNFAISMRIVLSIVIVFCLYSGANCQYLDLAKVEYTVAPGDDANFSYNSKRILFNVPFRIHDKAYFFAGVDYTATNINLREEMDSYDKSDTDNFTEIDLNLTYTSMMNNDWRFGVQITPSVNSNLQDGLMSQDLLMSGVIVFVKDKKNSDSAKKPFRIIAGLSYSTNSRRPIPFPFISYYRKFHRKWSYNVGAPVSNVQYHISEKHRIKVYAEGDGFNAHIQNGVIVNEMDRANRLRMLLILTGLRYEYKVSKHIESYLNVTRTVFSDVQLRDDMENVFVPAIDNLMHYRIGLRCKI